MDCFFCIFFSADIIAELRRKYFRDNETTNINAVRHNVLDCLFNAMERPGFNPGARLDVVYCFI